MSEKDKKTIDSIKFQLRTEKNDYKKIKLLTQWDNLIYYFDGDKGLILNLKVEKICLNHLKKKKLKPKQIYFLKKSLASAYNNLGLNFSNQAIYQQALSYFRKSLKLYHEIDYKSGLSFCYNNIGLIYFDQENYELALKNHLKCLKFLNLDSKILNLPIMLNNVAISYNKVGDQNKALEFVKKSYYLNLKEADTLGMSLNFECFGSIYQAKKNYDSAFFYFKKSIDFGEQTGDFNLISSNQSKIANQILEKNKDYTKALPYFKDAYKNAKAFENISLIKATSKDLYLALRKLGRYQEALAIFEIHEIYKAKIESLANNKATFLNEYKNETEKREAKIKSKTLKEKELSKIKLEHQKKYVFLLSLGIILVIALLLFIFNRLKITRKQKVVIEDQKKQVDQKNKKILDSIYYAENIQQAILPSKEHIRDCFPDSFVFFSPKDIVSGDFYWFAQLENKSIIAAADCTGHGVPGGFLSMLGSSLLNEIVVENRITQPAKILDLMSQKMSQSLKNNFNDGMDIIICVFENDSRLMEYAGAKHSLFLVEEGNVSILKTNIWSIGPQLNTVRNKKTEYTNFQLELKKDTSIYLISDGIIDQFGGDKSEKFGKKRFTSLLESLADQNSSQREEIIIKTINDWKKNEVQIDDQLLISLKIK